MQCLARFLARTLQGESLPVFAPGPNQERNQPMTHRSPRRARRVVLAAACGLLFQVGSAHAFLPGLMSIAQLGGAITTLVGVASKDPKTAQIGQMITMFSGGSQIPLSSGPGYGQGQGYGQGYGQGGYPPTSGSGYPPTSGNGYASSIPSRSLSANQNFPPGSRNLSTSGIGNGPNYNNAVGPSGASGSGGINVLGGAGR